MHSLCKFCFVRNIDEIVQIRVIKNFGQVWGYRIMVTCAHTNPAAEYRADRGMITLKS